MKKFLLAISALVAVVFTSCTKVEVKNEFGWYTNYNECIKQAKKENKKVILIVSRDEVDEVSTVLKEEVLRTPEFTEKYSNDYLFCDIDVSPSLFAAARPNEDASKEVKKDAKKFEKILDENIRVVTIFGVENTPTVYVVSPEGYVLKPFTYVPCKTVEEFDAMLNERQEEISAIETLITQVKESRGLEKVKAIDALYEATPALYRYMLVDLMHQVEKLDKKNETTLVGKYVMALATSDAMDAYMAKKPEKVASIYAKSAEHKMLTDEQKQQSYYAAAFVTGSNTPTPEETEQIIKYLEKAIEIDPESNIGKYCSELLATVKEFKVRQDAAAQEEKNIERAQAGTEEMPEAKPADPVSE